MLLKSIKIVVNQIYLVPENSPKWYSPTFEPIHSALGIFRLESLYHNVEISAIHILREIDFGKIKVLKTSILTIWYLANFSPDKMQKSTKTKLQMCWNCLNSRFWNSKITEIEFTYM